MSYPVSTPAAGRAPGRSQAGPHPLGGSADLPVGRGAVISAAAEFHLCIVQPAGYVHSLGLLDPARYLRWQLRRLGVDATLAKNRLREDAINIVFGAHLGFDPGLRERHTCVFFNLEQLGHGGAAVSAAYLKLLRGSAVADYDAGNVAGYCGTVGDVPVVPFLHAPYLADGQAAALPERPIDLLFFGSMNQRRRAFIDPETVAVENEKRLRAQMRQGFGHAATRIKQFIAFIGQDDGGIGLALRPRGDLPGPVVHVDNNTANPRRPQLVHSIIDEGFPGNLDQGLWQMIRQGPHAQA